MNTTNFQNLIQSVTGRNIIIETEDAELQNDKEYTLSVTFPITKIRSSFTWQTEKAHETIFGKLKRLGLLGKHKQCARGTDKH